MVTAKSFYVGIVAPSDDNIETEHLKHSYFRYLERWPKFIAPH